MKYLSITQTAERWGISTRRIQILCGEGRVPGAIRIGSVWGIPEDAEKPADARIKTASISRSPPKTKNEPHHVSTENILPDEQGVASFGTTDSSERVTYFQAEDVLVSNIRPYFKRMWFATTSGGCNADVLCFRALDKKYAYLLKSIMFQDGFFDYVMSGAKGTKMPRGDKTHIMLYPIPRFSETQLLKFIEYNKISFGEEGECGPFSASAGSKGIAHYTFLRKIMCQQECRIRLHQQKHLQYLM